MPVLDLNRFEIQLEPDEGFLPCTCQAKQVKEIEKRCGSIPAVASRIVSQDASYTELGHIVEIITKAGDPDSAPARPDIDAALLDLGLDRSLAVIEPLIERLLWGDRDPETVHNLVNTKLGVVA